jgi:hypothetical protein
MKAMLRHDVHGADDSVLSLKIVMRIDFMLCDFCHNLKSIIRKQNSMERERKEK